MSCERQGAPVEQVHTHGQCCIIVAASGHYISTMTEQCQALVCVTPARHLGGPVYVASTYPGARLPRGKGSGVSRCHTVQLLL